MSAEGLRGQRAMVARLDRLVQTFPDRAKMALVREAEQIMARSKSEFVPVDLSTLKNSGHVQPAVVRGRDISVTMAYGGAAEDYAVEQHETLSYKHTVGQAKYLERPLKQAERGMARRLGRDMDLEGVA